MFVRLRLVILYECTHSRAINAHVLRTCNGKIDPNILKAEKPSESPNVCIPEVCTYTLEGGLFNLFLTTKTKSPPSRTHLFYVCK